ncbi:MAG: type II toxin-antitoxin system PemK/MazF family toxin [Chitinophagales bacterium]
MAKRKPKVRRGDIWWVNFSPSIGNEIRNERPAIVLSNNIVNRVLRRYQVVPISRTVKKIYPSEVKINLNGNDCKAIIDQLTTVSKQRLDNKIGQISKEDMAKIEAAIKKQLGME